MQRDDDKDHKVRLAIGNGLRAEIWREFLSRFGEIEIREFYASTEGNVGFINYAGKIGAIGRVNFLHRVRGTREVQEASPMMSSTAADQRFSNQLHLQWSDLCESEKYEMNT